MASHLASVHFPDGKVLFATYSTVVERLLSGLYLQMDRAGQSKLVSVQAGVPRSHPDMLILVTIVEGPDHRTWPALYCPSRLEVIGPSSPRNVDKIQTTYELVPDSDSLLHLVEQITFSDNKKSVCGVELLGDAVPFFQPDDGHFPLWLRDEVMRLPERDLYGEWNNGTICRHCLCHLEVLDVEYFAWPRQQEEAAVKRRLEYPEVEAEAQPEKFSTIKKMLKWVDKVI
jgi:hypothetical protein